jgi:SAM-dependent methyltransferase
MILPKKAHPVWPKKRCQLTPEQQLTLEDWYAYWLGLLPTQFSGVVRFNNEYPLRTYHPGARTLEIGAGTGEHLLCENTTQQEYFALELRLNLAEKIRRDFPQVHTIVGDCERRLDLPDASIDRVIAIHVLEHLANLPAALDEIRRTLKRDGSFSVVIPCEGGTAYSLGRRFSSQRIFEKRYKQSYDWLISYEHINRADEIVAELRKRFRVSHRTFWPLALPSVHANLILGMTLQPR